jgi:hypothetical protein
VVAEREQGVKDADAADTQRITRGQGTQQRRRRARARARAYLDKVGKLCVAAGLEPVDLVLEPDALVVVVLPVVLGEPRDPLPVLH